MQLSYSRWLRRSWRFAFCAIVALAGILLAVQPVSSQPQDIQVASALTHAQAAPETIPLFYIENRGQAGAEVRYIAQTPELSAYFAPSGVSFAWHGSTIRMEFAGANAATSVEGADPLAGRANYLVGSDPAAWHTNLPLFAGVRYRQLYPGIDMVYSGSARRVKSDFIVAPGADPGRIRVLYHGARSVRLGSDGSLLVETAQGELREQAPVVYQVQDGRRVHVDGAFIVNADESVGFDIGAYDTGNTLWIDPLLSYSTYMGGSRIENATGVTVDSSGNAYVGGWTDSTDLPTANPMRAYSGSVEAFIMKYNSSGSGLYYATYIGGSGDDRAYGIEVDSSGNAILVGYTTSTNFPLVGAIQSGRAGGKDAFCLKLNAAGSALIYSTYFGGSGNDIANGVAVDQYGQAYVAGETDSSNFPIRVAVQGTKGGGTDAFLFKLNATGGLTFSTYLGGSGTDRGLAAAVATNTIPYLVGCTDSRNFPTITPSQPANAGGMDAFAVRLGGDGNKLLYSTYLGGSGGTTSRVECAYGVAVDAYSNAYIIGTTPSTNFPRLLAPQYTYGGGTLDAFATRLNSDGAITYSTYLGGYGTDVGTSIRVDSARHAYVAGYTSSNNFPLVSPVQSYFGGYYDGFFTRIDPSGASLNYSSYLGGSASDIILGLAYQATGGNLFLVGVTNSYNFPLLGARQPDFGGSNDAFVTKLSGAAN